MKKTPTRRNPVARALRNAAFKKRIVPARNREEKRATEKLRRYLRAYANIAGSIQPALVIETG